MLAVRGLADWCMVVQVNHHVELEAVLFRNIAESLLKVIEPSQFGLGLGC